MTTLADVAVVLTAATGLVTAVGGYIVARKVIIPAAKATHEVVTLAVETREAALKTTHMVNSQRDTMLERIDVLAQALQDAGIKIPPSPVK